jgi:hypothetical protein
MRSFTNMNKLALLASLTAFSLVAACGGSEDVAAPPADDAATAAESAAADAADELRTGTMEVSYPDGMKATITINSDGTYRRQPTEGLATAGIARMEAGRTCFDPSGPDPATCWTSTEPAADGSFTATSDDGVTVSVKPIG